jgi:hypothetical protein
MRPSARSSHSGEFLPLEARTLSPLVLTSSGTTLQGRYGGQRISGTLIIVRDP